ncbi:MAG: peptide deformylase [bacterium]|nr:peptide deformylase [bacterium]
MPILPITIYPTKSLREKSVPIEDPTTPEVQALIKDLYDTMVSAEGVGIAAPQVGKNIRLFLARTDNKRGFDVFINPRLSRKSLRKNTMEEGCLSVPGHYGLVRRHLAVTIHYTDEKGKERSERARGLFARVLQHEFDHIEGVLFIDRTKKVEPPLPQ